MRQIRITVFFFLVLLLESCGGGQVKRAYKKPLRTVAKRVSQAVVAKKIVYRIRPTDVVYDDKRDRRAPFKKAPVAKSESGKRLEKIEVADVESSPEDKESLTPQEQKDRAEAALESNSTYSGYFKVGSPYKVFGVDYVPQSYEEFEEIGTSSWYGPQFHGKKTANGEIYNMKDMTAAHPTLPLPSLVRVTNLRNNRTVIVRVNDRGPFAKNRIIDVSEKAAEQLDFKRYGTTEVKVQFLRGETEKMLRDLKIKK